MRLFRETITLWAVEYWVFNEPTYRSGRPNTGFKMLRTDWMQNKERAQAKFTKLQLAGANPSLISRPGGRVNFYT